MALPTLDATFASSADLPRKQMLAKWLIEELGSGSIADYYDLPERYLWAKIAIAAGGTKTKADYISLPTRYVWSDIYNAVTGSSGNHADWSEKEALGYIAAAYRGDIANPETLATYIDWPWRYQVASIIGGIGPAIDSDVLSFIELSGATDTTGLNDFVFGIKGLGLWNSMVCWPMRSNQNAGSGTTVYSLGGLGTFNGTMVNGPTWGIDGITFEGNYINVPLSEKSSYASFNFGSVFSIVNIESATRIAMRANPHWIGISTDDDTIVLFANDDGSGNMPLFTPTINTFYSFCYDKNSGTSNKAYINGGLQSTVISNLSLNSNPLIIGSYTDSNYFHLGKIAFSWMFSKDLTSTEISSIYTLYKNNLGGGLGLP